MTEITARFMPVTGSPRRQSPSTDEVRRTHPAPPQLPKPVQDTSFYDSYDPNIGMIRG